MSTLIRPEAAHAINGVPGRLSALHIPPAPWKPGAFANQTWVSELRPVEGYGPGSHLKVTLRFDDDCRNGHNTFAITAEVTIPRRRDFVAAGSLHDDGAKVFPELAHLIRWHLVSTDGPMHYIANTLYHALEHGPTHAWVYFTGSDPLGIESGNERLLGYKKAPVAARAEGHPGYCVRWDEKTIKTRNLDCARRSAVWPEATDEDLCAPADQLKAKLAARLPALMVAFRADIEGAGLLWECPLLTHPEA